MQYVGRTTVVIEYLATKGFVGKDNDRAASRPSFLLPDTVRCVCTCSSHHIVPNAKAITNIRTEYIADWRYVILLLKELMPSAFLWQRKLLPFDLVLIMVDAYQKQLHWQVIGY